MQSIRNLLIEAAEELFAAEVVGSYDVGVSGYKVAVRFGRAVVVLREHL